MSRRSDFTRWGPGTRMLAGGFALVLPFLIGASLVQPPPQEVVFRFADPAIIESSGLAVVDGNVITVNDSGDSGRVFTVDRDTGETIGVTRWAPRPRDVEALAPAGNGEVWVGDIGDNRAQRDFISVTRVPVGPGNSTVRATTYELTYPDGARDAETLLAHPRTGRLFIATKGALSGELYAAPKRLSPTGPNGLKLLGTMGGLLTDGAFLPSGKHFVVRTYGRASIYAFPSLRSVASWELPRQQQGEGLAVESADSVLLSSEGRRAPVLREKLPAYEEDGIGGLFGIVRCKMPLAEWVLPAIRIGLCRAWDLRASRR